MACGSSPVKRMKTTIARIETFPVNYPTVGWFKFLEGPKGRPAGRARLVVAPAAGRQLWIDGATGAGVDRAAIVDLGRAGRLDCRQEGPHE